MIYQSGQTWTVPITITVPCSIRDNSDTLRFKLYYTLKTKTGPVAVPFGDSLSAAVNIGSSIDTSKGEWFTGTGSPSFAGVKPLTTPVPMYIVPAPKPASSRFPVISTIVWIGLTGDE